MQRVQREFLVGQVLIFNQVSDRWPLTFLTTTVKTLAHYLLALMSYCPDAYPAGSGRPSGYVRVGCCPAVLSHPLKTSVCGLYPVKNRTTQTEYEQSILHSLWLTEQATEHVKLPCGQLAGLLPGAAQSGWSCGDGVAISYHPDHSPERPPSRSTPGPANGRTGGPVLPDYPAHPSQVFG